MTHDLIRNILFGLEAGVKKVVVSDLKEDTFYAVIWLGTRMASWISVDSPPQRRPGHRPAPGLPHLRRRSGAEDLEDRGFRSRNGQQRRTAPRS